MDIKPRIFISHSARGDAETMKLLDALSDALADTFAVRVDKEHIKLGEDWRHTLNTWIGGCDAAVVLLSPKALKSAFVAYEASILTFRPNVTVIPVFLAGVDENAIAGSDLAPSNIQARQGVAVVEQKNVDIIARVQERLKEVARSLTPVDMQAKYIEGRLQDVSLLLIEECLRELDVNLGSWERADNPRLSLAVKMMSAGIERATPCLRKIRKAMGKQALEAVFEAVATSWVDLRAASFIEQVAKSESDKRKLAMNGSRSLIAEIYIKRASDMPADDSWKVAEISGGFGESVIAGLIEQINNALASVLNLEPGEDLALELNRYERNHEPVFVALPAAGINYPVMQGLRQAFPTVTFFFLAGNETSSRVLLNGMNIEYLIPPLSEKFEEVFYDLYMDKKSYLMRF
jgi:hypothetical protein